MLKMTGLLVLLSLTLGCVQQNEEQTNMKEIESEVNQAFDGLVDAVRTMNVERYLGYFDRQEFTSLNDDGSVFHNFKQFESMYRQQAPYVEKYVSLEFDNVKITVINNSTAVLVNEYFAEVTLKSGDAVSASGAGTQVWSKGTGEWKLVNVSSSIKNSKE